MSFNIVIFLLFSLITFPTFSQIEINGRIIDENEKPLQGANVVLNKDISDSIIAYTTSNENGIFKLDISKGKFFLKITYLGYISQTIVVNSSEQNVSLGDIILIKSTSELNEVFIKAEKNIVVKGDTTIYKTKSFLNGTERTIGDVLLNLPGIGINENGKVTYGGKVVDRLLIDGEDLYKNQHQFATENLPSEMAGNVEVIKNYKDFENIRKNDKTGLTALNILIDDNFKNKFTGTLDVGAGIQNKYNLNPIIFNFSKTIKSSLITNFNNTGKTPLTLDDYRSLTNNNPIDSDYKASTVIFLNDDDAPSFITAKNKVKNRNINFFTLSSVYKPNKKTKFDYYAIFNNSNQNRETTNSQLLSRNSLPIELIETIKTDEENYFYTSRIKAIYKNSEKSIFKLNQQITGDISRNDRFLQINLEDSSRVFNEYFEPKSFISKTDLSYLRIFDKEVLDINAYFNIISDRSNLNIESSTPFLNLNFINDNFNLVQNNLQSELVSGLKLKLEKEYKRFGVKLLFNTSYNSQSFKTTDDNQFTLDNNLNLRNYRNRLGLSLSYIFNQTFQVSTNTSYNYNIKEFDNSQVDLSFVDFGASLKTTIAQNNVGTLSYSLNNEDIALENLIKNPVIIDYRNIIVNQNLSFNLLLPHHQFNYQHFIINSTGNSSFVLNASHKTRNKSIGTNVVNDNQLTKNSYQFINKDNFTSVFLFFEKKLKTLPLTLSNSLSANNSDTEYFQENILRNFRNKSLGGFFKISSNIKKLPISFSFGYRFNFADYNFDRIESVVSQNQPFVNFKGKFGKNINWEIDNFYNFFNVDGQSTNILYINPSIQYAKGNSDWKFGLIGNNLLNLNNNQIIENITVPGIVNRRTTSILEGYLLLNIEYRF